MIPLRHTERATPDAYRHQRNTCRHPVPRLARRPFLVSRTRHCCSTITAGTAASGDLNKADQTLICAASGGFTVVAPDCVEHGERRTDAWSRATFNDWTFICEAMDQTRQEAPALLDAALARPNLSAASPEGAGVSMDGLIAQTVFTQEKRSSFYQGRRVGVAVPRRARGWTRDAPAMPRSLIPIVSRTARCSLSMAARTRTARPPSTPKQCA